MKFSLFSRTHRLRYAALPGSVRPLCAPGCHGVQQRTQENPAESRQVNHGVEVIGHLGQSGPWPLEILRCDPSLPLKLKKKRVVTGGLWAHMCGSTAGPFRPFFIPDPPLHSSKSFAVVPTVAFPFLSAEAVNSLESFRGALRNFGAPLQG